MFCYYSISIAIRKLHSRIVGFGIVVQCLGHSLCRIFLIHREGVFTNLHALMFTPTQLAGMIFVLSGEDSVSTLIYSLKNYFNIQWEQRKNVDGMLISLFFFFFFFPTEQLTVKTDQDSLAPLLRYCLILELLSSQELIIYAMY